MAKAKMYKIVGKKRRYYQTSTLKPNKTYGGKKATSVRRKTSRGVVYDIYT